jgi:heat shock protein HslJ
VPGFVALCSAMLAACAAPSGPDAPPLPPIRSAILPPAMPDTETAEQLTGRVYAWQRTERGGSTITATAPERYTIEFMPNGRAALRADCNRGAASYTLPATGRLTISAAATTKMACPEGSQDSEFLRELAQVEAYLFTGRELKLILANDAGTMVFSALRSS